MIKKKKNKASIMNELNNMLLYRINIMIHNFVNVYFYFFFNVVLKLCG